MFKRPSVRYGRTPEPETPYQRAAQAWDERIGSARVQARNWRLMALGELGLIAGLAGALVWQSARGTVVPWVVQVDRLGQAQAVADDHGALEVALVAGEVGACELPVEGTAGKDLDGGLAVVLERAQHEVLAAGRATRA